MQKFVKICAVILILISFAEADPLRAKPHESYETKDDKIYFRRGNAGIILEAADSKRIEKYYADRGVPIGNPFVSIAGGMQNPAFFIVTLLNKTNGNLTFTPRYVIGKVKTDAYFPLDYLTMMEVLEDVEPHAKDIMQKSIYHSPELLNPGDVVSKFLIFPELPKKYDDLRLQFDYLYFENHEIKSEFVFTTRPRE